MDPEIIFKTVFGRMSEKIAGHLYEMRATDEEFKDLVKFLSKKTGSLLGQHLYNSHQDIINDHINSLTDKFNRKPDGTFYIENIHIDAAAKKAANDIYYFYH